MSKYLTIVLALFIHLCGRSQDTKGQYFYKPFPIFKSGGQVVIAGDIHTVVYGEYYGRDVRQEGYTNPHARPETLVLELFKDIKAMDLNGIGRLYDSTFDRKGFDAAKTAGELSGYEDIRFRSKFRCGDLIVVRYDFVSKDKSYAYFATIRSANGAYYLTSLLNIMEPFHLIGSLSPDNLLQKTEEPVNTGLLTPFYFVRKDDKVLFTNDLPQDEYTAVYIAFQSFVRVAYAPETEFVKRLQQAARMADTNALRNLVAPDQLPLLRDPTVANYFNNEIRKVFGGFPAITPLEGIRTTDGEVLYFSYADSSQTGNIASIILKSSGGKYGLAFGITDHKIRNILGNVYVREAIVDFMRRKLGQ
jgi:hypothetical protein